MSEKPHAVFVSHAHADNELCDRYVDGLRKRGLDVWYDRTNMQDGHFLSQDIEAQLRARTAFVLLITPASLASYWVRLEVGAFQSLAAQDSSRVLLPVRIAECEMPLLMMGIKWIDAVGLGFDTAIDSLAKALQVPGALHPTPAERVDVLIERAKTLGIQGKYDEMLATFDRALALYPGNADVWFWKSSELNHMGRYAEALAAAEQAVALAPNNAEAWKAKGANLSFFGRDDEMLAAYERALALNPDSIGAWEGKGDALCGLKRYEEALGAYDRALALDSNYVLPWYRKAKALRELGRTAEADAAERRAREMLMPG